MNNLSDLLWGIKRLLSKSVEFFDKFNTADVESIAVELLIKICMIHSQPFVIIPALRCLSEYAASENDKTIEWLLNSGYMKVAEKFLVLNQTKNNLVELEICYQLSNIAASGRKIRSALITFHQEVLVQLNARILGN